MSIVFRKAFLVILLLSLHFSVADTAKQTLKVGFGGAAHPHRTLPVWRQYGLYREFQEQGMLAD